MTSAITDDRPDSAGPSELHGRDLVLRYAQLEVVHGVSLELAPASVTALVGPNGSGKSTVLRALARLHAPASGTLAFADGTDALLLKRADFARAVTLLSQSRPVPHGLGVREVVEFGRHPHRGRWRAADPHGAAAVDRALALTGLADLADRGIEQLSGGQLQRVWLASCLAQQTGVLLLDEPTNHLDLRYQVEILDLVRELADDHGVAIGIVLHDLDQAAAIADRIVLLGDGAVVADGTAAEVLDAAVLSEVYGIRIDVSPDPTTGGLRTRAIGRHHTRTERTLPAS